MPSPSRELPAGAATAPAEARAGMPLTLKGLVACLLLVLYTGATATYVLFQRQDLARQLQEMDDLHALEEAFKRAALSVSNAMLLLRQVSMGEDPVDAARDSTPYALEAVAQALEPWQAQFPEVFAQHRLTRRRLATVVAQPSRANLLELREGLDMLGREIDRGGAQTRERRRGLGREYRDRGDRVTLTALALGMGGLLVFGSVVALFFARLAADLRRLGARAGEIVSGYRGAPLAVARRDEVGLLVQAVNRMGADLAAHERELEMARELRAHREKMAALGAMARNLSHEIGNPLATISAVVESARGGPAGGAGCAACQPELILEQTQRIARITRQIADFSGPRSDAPEPLDAGGMLRAVCEFMQFDSRFRGTRIEARVPSNLPVVVLVPDQLSEVLMNVLQLSVGAEGGAPPQRVIVEAAARGGGIAVRVSGGSGVADAARRNRTGQLVQSMGGHLSGGDAGGADIEIVLPGAGAQAGR